MTPADVLAGLRLDELCRAHQIIGAVAGVSVHGERAAVAAGVADVRTGAPVTTQTWFMAGSVTKAMTATMVNSLVAQGRLGLDDPVRRHLPTFRVADPEASDLITIRHLLTHTSGFDGDIWIDLGEGDDAIARFVDSLDGTAQLTPPGAHFSYNNAGFVVLGRIVEVTTGLRFEDALSTLIAAPSGARLTSDARRLPSADLAVGHVRTGRDTDPIDAVDPIEGPACLIPAGARTWTRVDDLLAFGELLLGLHGDDVTRTAVELLRTPQIAVADPNNGGTMGLGVLLDDRWGTPVVFHDGGVNGQSAYLRVLPEAGVVLVVVSTGGVPQVFHRHVFAALARSLGYTAPLGARPDPTVVVDVDRFVGHYAASATEAHVTAGPDGLRIVLVWGPGTDEAVRTPPLHLRAVDDRVFLAPLGGRDYVIVFPPVDEPCDHLLAGLRLLVRQA